MLLILAIIYAVFAGIINGSFALPVKRAKHWQFEHIWLNYALWAFIIIPWVSIFFLAPNVSLIYEQISLNTLIILGIGGLLFGIGQICFAIALKKIGFGLGFILNIGIATGLGFLLPLIVLHPQELYTSFGLVTLLGGALIIAGLVVYYQAGKARASSAQAFESSESSQISSGIQIHYRSGVILAVIAGVFSALQNFIFAATHEMQLTALQMGFSAVAASIIIWPIFLSFTFIPYLVYMVYLHIEQKSLHLYYHKRSIINIQLAVLMGLFWYGSLVLYSKSSLLIGKLGPVVAWPLFMGCIILTSNFWGWREQEWKLVSTTIKKQIALSILLLIAAVVVLGFSVTLAQ